MSEASSIFLKLPAIGAKKTWRSAVGDDGERGAFWRAEKDPVACCGR